MPEKRESGGKILPTEYPGRKQNDITHLSSSTLFIYPGRKPFATQFRKVLYRN